MSQALKCYKVFSAADMFDFSKLQPIMAWSHFAASVATRNPRFPYRIASFWEQTMKELKEKTRVRILRSGLVRWLVPVVGKHCCTCSIALLVLQVLFTKIVNVTGSPAVIKEDNTVDLELFQSTIMVHTRINDYPMVHFPLMWEVNAWRHVICGEVRAVYGHPEHRAFVCMQLAELSPPPSPSPHAHTHVPLRRCHCKAPPPLQLPLVTLPFTHREAPRQRSLLPES